MNKSEAARARLKLLEDNPKHTTATPETKKQTIDDDINDLKFHNLKPAADPHDDDEQIDASWKKDKNGTWYQEGGE